MSVPQIKTAFVAGEIAPALYGHVDLAKISVAATTLRNAFVNYRGGAYSRAGTAFVARSKQVNGIDYPPRLITFQYSITQGYALEFGDYYMRVYSDGAPVVEAAKAITGATNANPCQLTVAANGYSDGDWVVIAGVGGMTELNGNTYIVQGAATNTFTLTDLNGNAINSTAYAAYASGGTVSRIYTLVTPYAAGDLPLLKFTQSADVMSFTHQSYPPYDLSRTIASDWTITEVTLAAVIDAPGTVSGTATVAPNSGLSPPTLPCAYAYVVTAVAISTGEESNASSILNITNSVDISQTAGSIIVSWSAVAGASYYNVYKAPASYNTDTGSTTNAYPVPAGAIFGYVGTSYGTQFIDTNIEADTQQVPPIHKDPFAPGQILGVTMTATGSGYPATGTTCAITSATGSGFIGEPVVLATGSGQITAVIVLEAGKDYAAADTISFTGSGGSGATATLVVGPETGTYPGVVAYYQQRRVYASSANDPDTYWLSQPGLFLNFDSGIPLSDSDAITGTPWAVQVNGIQFMVPMPGGLVVLTGKGAWQVTGSGGSAGNPVAITPASQQAQPQAFNGCSATVPPIPVNYDILYVQSKGSIVRDIAYNYWLNMYTGSDLTELSGQLFTGFTILQWAWCEEPYKIVWVVRSDNTLLSLTFLKEQEVYGWARHDTFGLVESVCSVTEPPVDALYLVTVRVPVDGAAGHFYIERMDNRIWNGPEDPWCVDCGLALPMPTPNATLSASGTSGTVVFTATSGVFSPESVGQVIRMGGGIAVVTAYADAQHVNGTLVTPIIETFANDPTSSAIFQTAGNWSITPPVTLVGGLSHLEGLTVTGLADGIVIPPQVVSAAGTITLAQPASNIKVGLPFTAQVQSPYLDGGQPTIQGRRKTITGVTVRVDSSGPVTTGSNQPDGAAQSPPMLAPAWTGMTVATPPTPTPSYTAPGGGTVSAFFTGDLRANVGPNWTKPGQVAVQQTLPQPMQITALIPETLEGDLPEQGYSQDNGQKDPRQGPRGPGAWMLRG